MQIIVRKLNNPATGHETGAILTAVVAGPTTLQQKIALEAQLSDYAFTRLYPNEGLNIYRNEYVDTPSIVAIKGINDLADSTVTHP